MTIMATYTSTWLGKPLQNRSQVFDQTGWGGNEAMIHYIQGTVSAVFLDWRIEYFLNLDI